MVHRPTCSNEKLMKIKNGFVEFCGGKMRNCLRIFREKSFWLCIFFDYCFFFLERYLKYSLVSIILSYRVNVYCKTREIKLESREELFLLFVKVCNWNSKKQSNAGKGLSTKILFHFLKNDSLNGFLCLLNFHDVVHSKLSKNWWQFFSILLFLNN